MLVNSARNELNLKNGNLSKAFYAAAGSIIQKECSTNYPLGINYGGIAITSRFIYSFDYSYV